MNTKLLSIVKRKNSKTTNYKEEAFVKAGREQFIRMIDKGIELPVVLL